MNLLKKFENQEIKRLESLKEESIPFFRAGDTVAVHIKTQEAGGEARTQVFEGIVIAKENRGINSSILVRKTSHGEGVERKFKIYSPMVSKIALIKQGIVRRAKLYYLRDLKGKAARIKQKIVTNKK